MKTTWTFEEIRAEYKNIFCADMAGDLAYRTALMEIHGAHMALKDMPNFKDSETLRKTHVESFCRGYERVVSIDGEHHAEYLAEKAAERYFEEGPYGSLYDDPRGE